MDRQVTHNKSSQLIFVQYVKIFLFHLLENNLTFEEKSNTCSKHTGGLKYISHSHLNTVVHFPFTFAGYNGSTLPVSGSGLISHVFVSSAAAAVNQVKVNANN